MSTSPSLTFGTLLRRHRIAAGLTQEELAECAGVSRRSIGDMERGVAHRPRKDTITLLASALLLSPPDQSTFTASARQVSAPVSASSVRPSGAEPPFVGRARELALLDRHLGGEGPPLLLLAGEPGIGKTRLLHAAIARGAGYGLRVLEGGCQRRGGHEPYAPLLGALQRYLREQRTSRLRADLLGCAWLVKLLPELVRGPIEPLPAWTLSPEHERRLMVEAVARFLSNVAGPAGTLLVLDDLQWAGPDAIDLLAVLVRSSSTAPLRVIGAYRETEVGAEDPLSVLLADLAHAGLAAQRLLGPLAPEEAERLVAELLEGINGARTDLQAEILRRAGGVPFFVVSCARELRAGEGGGGGACPRGGGGGGGAGAGAHDGASRRVGEDIGPWAVAQSVRQRVAALSDDARVVLSAAAVVGRVVPHSLLAGVTGRSETALFSALGVACRAGLLAEGDQVYRFTHDVIREVIEHDVGLARRAALHHRVAEALEQQPGEPPVERLAYHFSRSEDQAKAVLYLEQAGDRAITHHAHAAAQDYYRQAMDRLDRLGYQREVAGVCEKLGGVLMTMGHYVQALEILDRAVAIHRAARNLEAEGWVTAIIGRVHFEAGTWEEGIARVRSVLADLETRDPSPALAALYVALIPLFAPTGRYREYLATAECASALARSLGDSGLLAESEVWRGVALAELDRPVDARPVLEGAIPLAEAARRLRSLGRALAFLGGTYLTEGAFARAREMREQALDAAERLGDPLLIGWVTCRLADVHVLAGAWPQARILYERAVAGFHRLGGVTRFSSIPLVGLGTLALHEGNGKEASRYLEEGAVMAARASHLGALRASQQALAERDLLDGRPWAALARLQTVLKDLDLEDSVLTKPMQALAQAHLALGNLDDAEALVAAGVTRARGRCNSVGLVEWRCLQGIVWTYRGRYEDAQRELTKAITQARRMPYPYVEARLQHVYGLLHIQRDEPAPARERLEAALIIFQKLGAHAAGDRTKRVLAVLG